MLGLWDKRLYQTWSEKAAQRNSKEGHSSRQFGAAEEIPDKAETPAVLELPLLTITQIQAVR